MLAQMDKDAHITTPDIMALIAGELDAPQAAYVQSHVATCRACAAELEELREIDEALVQAVEEREHHQAQARAAFSHKGQPLWRFASAALAIACLALCTIPFTHMMQVNRNLSQAASAQQRRIDSLQRRLAQKVAADTLIRTQQQQLDEKEKQVAQARIKAQHLQTQLNALKERAVKQQTNLVAQRDEKQLKTVPINPSSRPNQIAKNTPKKEGIASVNRTLQVALAEKRLPLSGAYQANMIGSGGLEMGEGGTKITFYAVSPIGTNLLTDRPTFTWTPVENATAYEVVVQDERGHVLADSHSLPGAGTTQWRPPTVLPRDQVLHWSVTARNGDTHSLVAPDKFHPVALFTILSETKVKAIKRQAISLGDSPKALAVLYAKENLLDDAEREARAWQMTDPDAEVARAWLSNLRAYRRGAAVKGEQQPNE